MRGLSIASRRPTRAPLVVGALVAASLALPAIAFGHLERPSYWPDPAPDTSITPAAGGKVPEARSLASAVTGAGPGEVRVVCEGERSLRDAIDSIDRAETNGFRLRPSLPRRRLSSGEADQLREINRALAEKCSYRHVQDAIDDSHNNDRVVIMPGRYTEPKSRKAPVNDPRCNPSLLQQDQSGADTPSYNYQAKCSNDQNLIYVQGRAVKGGVPEGDPDPDRHGIPPEQLGRCIRCNLQIEGSGARPEDVILDAGKGYENAGRPGARPGGDTPAEECLAAEDGPDNPCYAKHVVLRGDRTDGMVGRNFTMRGAKEHGFYTEESDGVLLDRVKFFWNADYGHLSFTSDHHLVKNCDGYGSGDSVVYPGAAPQTGEFRDESFYPSERYNTVIKKCDLHGSAMGYSGSMGNSVRVTKNRFYGNANGLTSDTISAPGHPGFPADGQKVDHNWFYSNNLDVYDPEAEFEALVPQAIGTGIMWPGMNNGVFSHNRVFDNWRHGTLLVAIPDEAAGEAEGNVDGSIHCPEDASASTSCDNRYFRNRMGSVPEGFRRHPGLEKFGNETGITGGNPPNRLPNGVDFWWDEYPTNDGNCWYENEGPDGTAESLTADPPFNPAGPTPPTPGFLPEDCNNTSGGPGYGAKGPLLLECFAEWEARGAQEVGDGPCYWYEMPSQPGTSEFQADRRAQAQMMRELARSPEAQRITEHFQGLAGEADPGP